MKKYFNDQGALIYDFTPPFREPEVLKYGDEIRDLHSIASIISRSLRMLENDFGIANLTTGEIFQLRRLAEKAADHTLAQIEMTNTNFHWKHQPYEQAAYNFIEENFGIDWRFAHKHAREKGLKTIIELYRDQMHSLGLDAAPHQKAWREHKYPFPAAE